MHFQAHIHLTNLILKIILSRRIIKFIILLVVMNKKSLKNKKVHNDSKQNMMSNGHQHHEIQTKRKIIKKQDHSVHPLQESIKHKNPQELRALCEKQEKQILAEYKAKKLDHQFYEFVRGQLANSKICNKIMKIKDMTNQEAQEELSRLQEFRGKGDVYENDGQSYMSSKNSQSFEEEEEIEIEERVVFRHCIKKVSMIEDNDDAYLQDIGANHYDHLPQVMNVQEMEDEGERPQHSDCVSYASNSACQYQVNDDIFEF